MIRSHLCYSYAAALFHLACENQNEEIIDQQFAFIRDLSSQNPKIKKLMANSTVSIEGKIDFFEKVLPAEIELLLRNFIKVVIRKKRFSQLAAIYAEYRRLFAEKKGIREVRVLSAAKLSSENQRKLIATLKKKFKAEIRLSEQIEPDILGGLIIRSEGMEWDASYRSRLEEIRQKLTCSPGA